jgi:indolepyruvate ferredoxin oxidoreductase alpha subunit
VVEELSPYLEHQAKKIAQDEGLTLNVLGKESRHFSESMEYNPAIVVKGIASALDMAIPIDYDKIEKRASELKAILPERIPVFCAGCPHRATFWSIKQAIRGRNVVFNNDIGCYSMAYFPPLNMTMSLLCMGASLGVSAGMSQVLEDDVMCVVGDSTFFHAALPGLVNAVYHNLPITLFVLHNEVTAMTGQQTHPSTPEGRGKPKNTMSINIEDVCKGIGVEHITIIDSYDVKNNIPKIKEALDFKGPSVIISRHSCALHGDRIKRRTGVAIIQNEVDKDVCKKPHTCIRDFYCPSFVFDTDDRAARIQPEICDGCGVCAKICPFDSIHPIGEKPSKKEVEK